MSDFEKWFRSLNANGKTVYFLGNEHKVSEMAWNHQQATIDSLKTQLNNMEACYIQVKKDKAELLGVISDALEALNDSEFNYCQKQLEMHAKPLRGDCE